MRVEVIVLVLAAIVSCIYGIPTNRVKRDLKTDLLNRTATLVNRAEVEVARLQAENRASLANKLLEIIFRVNNLAQEVINTNDANGLKELEDELDIEDVLLEAEFRRIKKDDDVQDDLLKRAKDLDLYLTNAIITLRATTGRRRTQALKTADNLRDEQDDLTLLVYELVNAKELPNIEQYEQRLTALETRIFNELSQLGFIPSTIAPTTARASTAAPTTARASTAAPTTARASTAAPTTARASTRAPTTARASTVAPTTARASSAAPTTARSSSLVGLLDPSLVSTSAPGLFEGIYSRLRSLF